MVVVTALLLAATGAVVAMRIGGFLPANADVLFLTPREPNAEASDDQKDWDDTTSVEIFSAEYKNAAGEVVVKSLVDDEAVIAPGTEQSYKFYLKNTGNVALDYSILLDPKFMIDYQETSLEGMPFEVRIHNQHGTYLIGSEDEWVNMNDVEPIVDQGIVGKNSYYSYVLEWRWLFETGDDERDTMLGNLSVNQPVAMTLDIGTTAEESIRTNGTGGSSLEEDEGRAPAPDPGTISIWPAIVLGSLTLIAIITLIALIVRRMKTRTAAKSTGLMLGSMAAVGGSLSVMFSKMFKNNNKKK